MASLSPGARGAGASAALHGSLAAPGPAAALRAHLALARPPEALVVFGATLAGARVAAVPHAPAEVLSLAASNMLLFAASMIYNDWHDVEEDRINKPRRPIASGRVPPKRAMWIGVWVFALGVAAALPLGPPFLIGALCATAASVTYTRRLKGVPLVGNLLVAVVSTYALACWMLRVTPDPAYLALAVGCLFARLGGEIVKTAEDRVGDDASGLRTLATCLGERAAGRIGLGCVSLGLLLAAVPILLGVTDPAYAALLGLSALLILTASIPWLRGGDTQPAATGAVVAQRIVMLLMLVAIGVGVAPQS